jgi:hypothetical protein
MKHYNDREAIQHWVEKYEKAVKDGKLEGAPTPRQDVERPTQNLEGQSQIWQQYAGVGSTNSSDQAIMPDDSGLLQEDNKDVGNAAQSILQSPNPVRTHTVGPDQDLSATSMGLTFSEKDIEDLAELKLQLHSLQDKLNAFEGRGENSSKFENQINEVKTKIDELSTILNQCWPNISQQGD